MIFDSNGNDFVVWSSLEFAKKIRISPECSSKWSQYFSITYHVPVFFSLSPRNRDVKNSVFSGWIYFEFLYLGHTFIALNNVQFSMAVTMSFIADFKRSWFQLPIQFECIFFAYDVIIMNMWRKLSSINANRDNLSCNYYFLPLSIFFR